MAQQLKPSSYTPDGSFTCYSIGDNSHNSTLQDVNKHQGLAYSKPALKCQGGSWVPAVLWSRQLEVGLGTL